MFFKCYLCNSEYVFTTYLCSECCEISRIVKVVNKDTVLNILKDNCLKSNPPIKKVQFTEEKQLTKSKSYSEVLNQLQDSNAFK